MKNKLFAIVLLTSLYMLFIVGFSVLDNQGSIKSFFTEIGLSSETAVAASGIQVSPSFQSPAPKPDKPTKPKPDPDVI